MKKQSIIEYLPWDSDFFKKKIARLSRTSITKRHMKEAIAAAKKGNIECLYATLEADDQRHIELAEQNGLALVGTRVTYAFSGKLPTAKSSDVSIREGTDADREDLLRLAAILSRESRFARDPHFGATVAKRLYRTWIEKLLFDSSPRTSVLVATVKGKFAGFIASSVHDGMAHIELIIVDGAFRGKGIGKLLIAQSTALYRKQGFTQMRVSTQGSNIAAQSLYQSCGFRIARMALDYHKWFV
ncbi:GNAT family N-acetyltransferase [Candidatus Parcubacteria bacterium]|nr:MAG: GNAT family N-acetyltransferase [Candidatus Parcubacteria bacterium]